MFRSSHSEPRHLKLFDQPCSLIRCTSSVATMKRWHQASAIYIEGIVFVIFAIFCEGFSFHPRDRRCPRRNLWPAHILPKSLLPLLPSVQSLLSFLLSK